jgi:hypothetical protein
MSNALTTRNRKLKGQIDPASQQLFDNRLSGHFPSYFGNFGNFSRLLMLRMQARLTKRRLRQEHSFPVITAFMAIV